MKYTLINQEEINIPVPGYDDMYRGIPWQISIEHRDGYWYSTWQVVLHCPSPTGDSSDWIQFDVGCLSREQAILIAKHYASAFKIPGSRIRVENDKGYYESLDDSQFNGRIS
jgi:hypothetical protein